jgi:hypothetical protein
MFDYEPDPAFWSGVPGLVVIVFFFVMAVVWFFLPFTIFSIKKRLDDLIAETRATKAAINELAEILLSNKH